MVHAVHSGNAPSQNKVKGEEKQFISLANMNIFCGSVGPRIYPYKSL